MLSYIKLLIHREKVSTFKIYKFDILSLILFFIILLYNLLYNNNYLSQYRYKDLNILIT